MDTKNLEFTTENFVVKQELRQITGYIVISEIEGEPYYDLHDDYLPSSTLAAAIDDYMMSNSRPVLLQHTGSIIGKCLSCFVLDNDNAKGLRLNPYQTGLIITLKITDDEAWETILSGSHQSFSIGAYNVSAQVVESE